MTTKPYIVLFVSLFIIFSMASLPTPSNTIQHLKITIDKAIDKDEVFELTQFLSYLINKPALSQTIAHTQNAITSLEKYKSAICHYEKENSDCTLLCSVKRTPMIRKIIINNLPLTLLEKDLRKRLPIHAGEHFDPDSFDYISRTAKTQESVQSFLEKQGFYDAIVDTAFYLVPNSPTIDIIININNGSFRKVNKVTLSDGISFEQKKIRSMFKNMCFNFQDLFNVFSFTGFSCYSRERERNAIENLQKILAKKHYPTATVSTQKTLLDPLDKKNPSDCLLTKSEAQKYALLKVKPPAKCLDIHISIDLGPQILTTFTFDKAQALQLSPIEQFFRTLFGIEFFSRTFNISLVGAKWPADETIIINELQNAVSFSSSHKIDESELKESIRNIKAALAKRGYLNAEVDAEFDNFNNQIIKVNFHIKPHMPFAVTQINFAGEPIFTKAEILTETSLPIKSRSALQPGHYDEESLTESIIKIKAFYTKRGYKDAQIQVKKQITSLNNLELVYIVSPGILYTIESITFENGIDDLLPQILPILANCQKAKNLDSKMLTSSAICSGSPSLPKSISDDENRILDILKNNGYLHAKIKTKIIQTDFKTKLIFQLNEPRENPQVHMAGIFVDGNVLTQRDVILRQMGKDLFKNNPPINVSTLEKGIASLRQTNLFSRINYNYIAETGSENKSYVLLSLIEKAPLTLDLFVGFSSDDLFSVGTEFNDANLFGSMLQFRNRLDLGLFWGYKSNFQNRFKWPWIYGLPLTLEIIAPQITYNNYVTRYPFERHLLTQLSATLDWQISSVWFSYLKFETRFDKWQQQNDLDSKNKLETIDGFSQILKEPTTIRNILTPGINYVNLDHPINPKKGLQLDLSTNLSFAALGAQIPFQIFNAYIIHYMTKGSFTFASQLLFRRAFINSPEHNWWVLKYQGNMDALGGDRSVRGYQPSTIGIWGPILDSRDGKILLDNSNDPILGYHPGNLSFQGNFEIRFPLRENLFIGDLNGVIFTDIALVDNCEGLFNCSLLNATNSKNLDTQLGWSLGMGLRYLLPIGPISLEWAFSPLRKTNNLIGREARLNLFFGYIF